MTTTPVAVSPGPAQPTALGDRLRPLDVLRGVAVLGILTMNIVSYALPSAVGEAPAAASSALYAGPLEGWNRVIWLVQEVIFEQKMYSTFAMLFGCGIILYGTAASGRSKGPRTGLWYRRCLVLLGFGMLHAYGLWFGDVLTLYAVCGMALWPLRSLPVRALVGLSIALHVLGVMVFTVIGTSSIATGRAWTEPTAFSLPFKLVPAPEPRTPPELPKPGYLIQKERGLDGRDPDDESDDEGMESEAFQLQDDGAWRLATTRGPPPESSLPPLPEGAVRPVPPYYDWMSPPADLEREVKEKGGSAEGYYRRNAADAIGMQFVALPLFAVPKAAGMMLLGMALMRARVHLRRDLAARVAKLGLSVGGALILAWVACRLMTGVSNNAEWLWVGHLNYFGSSVFAVGLFGLVIVLGPWMTLGGPGWLGIAGQVSEVLARVGRMAMSNYLLQSLVCTAVFSGAGFGLFGTMQRWELALVVLMIWCGQGMLSVWWMGRFSQGPLESVWKMLTYGSLGASRGV